MTSPPQSADRLSEPIQCADVNRDVQTVINVKGSGHNIPEQLLPDFYAEDMTNVMNRERRKKVRTHWRRRSVVRGHRSAAVDVWSLVGHRLVWQAKCFCSHYPK